MNWNSRTNRITIKWVNHNGWIDIFVIKKTFCVRIFNISPYVFTQILIERARWMRDFIPHPTSTHTAYLWRIWLPIKQEIPEKTWWWCISCFWGSGVRQKYAVWVLVGCGIKFCIQQALHLKFELKHREICRKYKQEK